MKILKNNQEQAETEENSTLKPVKPVKWDPHLLKAFPFRWIPGSHILGRWGSNRVRQQTSCGNRKDILERKETEVEPSKFPIKFPSNILLKLKLSCKK